MAVEYGQDGMFVTAQVWPDTETQEGIIAAYKERLQLEKECTLTISEAVQLDPQAQYELSYKCLSAGLGTKREPQAEPLHWKWICLAAHGQHGDAQRRMGILLLMPSFDDAILSNGSSPRSAG